MKKQPAEIESLFEGVLKELECAPSQLIKKNPSQVFDQAKTLMFEKVDIFNPVVRHLTEKVMEKIPPKYREIVGMVEKIGGAGFDVSGFISKAQKMGETGFENFQKTFTSYKEKFTDAIESPLEQYKIYGEALNMVGQFANSIGCKPLSTGVAITQHVIQGANAVEALLSATTAGAALGPLGAAAGAVMAIASTS